jgi:hypothetical protein
MGDIRNAYNTFVGKYERKRPRGRPRRRGEDSITVDVMEIGWDFVDWVQLAQDMLGLPYQVLTKSVR